MCMKGWCCAVCVYKGLMMSGGVCMCVKGRCLVCVYVCERLMLCMCICGLMFSECVYMCVCVGFYVIVCLSQDIVYVCTRRIVVCCVCEGVKRPPAPPKAFHLLSLLPAIQIVGLLSPGPSWIHLSPGLLGSPFWGHPAPLASLVPKSLPAPSSHCTPNSI